MAQLEYDRGALLTYNDFRYIVARVYLLKSRSVGGRHGHLGCAAIPMHEEIGSVFGRRLVEGYVLFGNKGFTLPKRCGWLNVVAADES